MSEATIDQRPRERLLQTIAYERTEWQELVDDVGPDRLETPGAMGRWTFRDLAAHLTFWSDYVIDDIYASPSGKRTYPWPDEIDREDDDAINAWVQQEQRKRTQDEVLADADALYDRLDACFRRAPDVLLLERGIIPWVPEEMTLAEFAQRDLFRHLHEDHEPDVRAMLIVHPRTQ